MDLHFDIPNYHVDILKISNTNYQLEVYHKESSQTRVYDINEEINRIDFDDLSLRFNITFDNDDKTYLHLNFENESIIVGDIFEEHTEEFVDTFMSHDFME